MKNKENLPTAENPDNEENIVQWLHEKERIWIHFHGLMCSHQAKISATLAIHNFDDVFGLEIREKLWS